MNNKGFMMAELIVVSSIILLVLVGLYESYNKLYSVYKTRISYYDVTSLYKLGFYRDVLRDEDELENVKNDSIVNPVLVYNSKNLSSGVFALSLVDDDYNDIAYMVNIKNNKIDIDYFNNKVHVTFLDYIDYLNGSVDFSSMEYVMLIERCNMDNENECTYAYLEVIDEC